MNINPEAHEVSPEDLNAAAAMYDNTIRLLDSPRARPDALQIMRNTLHLSGLNNHMYGTNLNGETVHIHTMGYEFTCPYENEDGEMVDPGEVNEIVNANPEFEEALEFDLVDVNKKNPIRQMFAGAADGIVYVVFIRTNSRKIYTLPNHRAFARRLLSMADKTNRKEVMIDGIRLQFT
ncbi:MAG: hypothetical protein DRI46_08055 [Chloroflexi bacterium]|nr:MAG: hypothetical protein DRI46_08055 [Chloroflexota bacterium]